MKKAVVFGGSGFLGSHVADHLTNAGYETVVFDIKESEWLRNDQRMVIGDILNQEEVSKVIKGAEAVYNFAAIADLNQAIEKPLETANINILGNLYILEACRTHKINRFIYASSVYVYSREGGFYRISKQASEAYIKEYHHVYNCDYTILQYGSLYGPRADHTNGLRKIVQAALKEGNIQYKGDPEAVRSYIHVEDAARASIEMLKDDYKNESVVLTGHEPMCVKDMLKMLTEILGFSEKSIEFLEGNQIGHYVRSPYAHDSKIGKKFIPPMHIDLGQGLLQLIKDLTESNTDFS